jgi:hypothetical protein
MKPTMIPRTPEACEASPRKMAAAASQRDQLTMYVSKKNFRRFFIR